MACSLYTLITFWLLCSTILLQNPQSLVVCSISCRVLLEVWSFSSTWTDKPFVSRHMASLGLTHEALQQHCCCSSKTTLPVSHGQTMGAPSRSSAVYTLPPMHIFYLVLRGPDALCKFLHWELFAPPYLPLSISFCTFFFFVFPSCCPHGLKCIPSKFHVVKQTHWFPLQHALNRNTLF